jgi:type I restriction enzyme S subunit
MMFRNTKVSDVVTGVAQPKISQARLSAKKILIPETKFVLKYSEIIEPYMKGILVLQEQNEHLAESRDRLLPKLISGEIEVWYFCEDFEYQMLRVICDS